MKSYAEVLSEERIGAGLSLRQLGEVAGLDHGYLSRIESGDIKRPRRTNVIRLADAIARHTDPDQRVATQERLRSRLLRAAGLAESSQPIITDVKRRFAARLREEDLQEHQIEAALNRVTIATMQRVLSGEEPIEKYPLSALHDPEAKLNFDQETVVLPGYEETIQAGQGASIRVTFKLTPTQRAQLTTIARLIGQIVSDRSS